MSSAAFGSAAASAPIDPASRRGLDLIYGKNPVAFDKETGEGYVSVDPPKKFSYTDTNLILDALARAAPVSAAAGASSSAAAQPSATKFMYQKQNQGFCRMHSLNHVFQTLGVPLITFAEYDAKIQQQKDAILDAIDALEDEVEEAQAEIGAQEQAALAQGAVDIAVPGLDARLTSISEYIAEETYKTSAFAPLDATKAAGPLNNLAVRQLLASRGLSLVPLYMHHWEAGRHDEPPTAANVLSGLPMADERRGERSIDYTRGNYILEGYYPNQPAGARHAVTITNNLYLDSNMHTTDADDLFDPKRWLYEIKEENLPDALPPYGSSDFRAQIARLLRPDRVETANVKVTRTAMSEAQLRFKEAVQLDQRKCPTVAIVDVDAVGWAAEVVVPGPLNSRWTFPLQGLRKERYSLVPFSPKLYAGMKRDRENMATRLPRLPHDFVVDTVFAVVYTPRLPAAETMLRGHFLNQEALYNEFVRVATVYIGQMFSAIRARAGQDPFPTNVQALRASQAPFLEQVVYAYPGIFEIPHIDDQGEHTGLTYKEAIPRLSQILEPWIFGSGHRSARKR